MKKHKYVALATVIALTVLAGGTFLPRLCGEVADAEHRTLPRAVREASKDADVVLALVPKVGKDGQLRIWVALLRPDLETDIFTTAGSNWTSFMMHDRTIAYIACSLKGHNDMALTLAGVEKLWPNAERH